MAHNKVKSQHYNGLQGEKNQTNKRQPQANKQANKTERRITSSVQDPWNSWEFDMEFPSS